MIAHSAQPSRAVDTPQTPGTLLTAAAQNAGGVGTLDAMWQWEPIDGTRWDRLYPYQIAVVEAVQGPSGASYRKLADQVFTLPLPPEALAITMQFAIGGSV